MLITDSKKISEIQREFSSLFSGLKIEFFNAPHELYEVSSSTDKFDEYLAIGQIRNIHNSKELKIDPKMTVSLLEILFKRDFGLNVQVYRKSKHLWLQTSATDSWTLEKQNTKGIASMDSNVGLYDRV